MGQGPVVVSRRLAIFAAFVATEQVVEAIQASAGSRPDDAIAPPTRFGNGAIVAQDADTTPIEREFRGEIGDRLTELMGVNEGAPSTNDLPVIVKIDQRGTVTVIARQDSSSPEDATDPSLSKTTLIIEPCGSITEIEEFVNLEGKKYFISYSQVVRSC